MERASPLLGGIVVSSSCHLQQLLATRNCDLCAKGASNKRVAPPLFPYKSLDVVAWWRGMLGNQVARSAEQLGGLLTAFSSPSIAPPLLPRQWCIGAVSCKGAVLLVGAACICGSAL